jgi:hypothetical protein
VSTTIAQYERLRYRRTTTNSRTVNFCNAVVARIANRAKTNCTVGLLEVMESTNEVIKTAVAIKQRHQKASQGESDLTGPHLKRQRRVSIFRMNGSK